MVVAMNMHKFYNYYADTARVLHVSPPSCKKYPRTYIYLTKQADTRPVRNMTKAQANWIAFETCLLNCHCRLPSNDKPRDVVQ